MKIEYRTTGSLLPYANNSKEHPESQVLAIMNSIREFGFNKPVAIDQDGVIIAGHGAVMAAERLGINTVPVVVLSHLSEAKKRAYIIADNKTSMMSGFDMDKLADEMAYLLDMEFDLETTGFTETELDLLFKGEQEFHQAEKPLTTVGAHTRKGKDDSEELEEKEKSLKIIFKCTQDQYDEILKGLEGILSAERLIQLIRLTE